MSYFKELTVTCTFHVAVPAKADERERSILCDTIQRSVRDALLQMRKDNVNFLPLEVVTRMEGAA